MAQVQCLVIARALSDARRILEDTVTEVRAASSLSKAAPMYSSRQGRRLERG